MGRAAVALGEDITFPGADELNLRAEPTLDAEVVAELTAGTIGIVIDGPVAADGYTWFAVTSADLGDGWVAGQFFELVSTTDTAETATAAESFGPIDNPGHGVLELTPYRIALVQFPTESIIWTPDNLDAAETTHGSS